MYVFDHGRRYIYHYAPGILVIAIRDLSIDGKFIY
jgi:hypothetical protein